MAISLNKLLEATHLTRLGKLGQATRLIQRTLGIAAAQTRPQPVEPHQPPKSERTPIDDTVVDVQFRQASDAALPQAEQRPAQFTEGAFSFGLSQYAYRLFVPAIDAAAASAPLPLVVLLHGCKQDAADFAQGTAMNELAQQQPCIVLYPEQLTKANSMRCWNWFEPAHQQRDAGEPGMIAALTRQIVQDHHADPARVYIAGLSAGGAMAALMAGLYPDLYAAAGVHSGIPSGAASNVIAAFGAMRRGAQPASSAAPQDSEPAIPMIVFHGSADKTVHPDNGDQIVAATLAAFEAQGQPLEPHESSDDSRRTTQRTVYRAADGKAYVEHWSVDAGPHAWSGGDAAGSFTDPQGPSASAAMLAFWLQHRKP